MGPVSDSPDPTVVANATSVDAISLQYAPPARGAGRGRPLAALGGGAVTSAAAVLGVYLLARFEHEDPFAWHALFLLPVGSLLVAAVAASGFLFAVRLTHVRAGRGLAVAAAALMVLAYLAALYVEFAPFHWVSRRTGLPVTFAGYVHQQTISWVWRFQGETVHLGPFGYIYRLLDLAVFACAGAIAVELTCRADHCDLCRTYVTHRRLALFPASSPYRNRARLSAEDRADFHADQEDQMRAALEGARLMLTLAEAGDVDALREVIAGVQADRRSIARLPSRLALDIDTCPGCRATTLRTLMLVGRTSRRLDALPVSGAFADLLRNADDGDVARVA
jgi:membrane protein YdbS with pleckstrin-like domain